MALTEKQFQSWLTEFGDAWQARNTGRFAGLFAENALFYWTPFDEPKRGRADLAAAFSAAVSEQEEIEFGARILYTQALLGAAHWSCSFTRSSSAERIHLDGVLVVQFSDGGEALSYRQWWHSDER